MHWYPGRPLGGIRPCNTFFIKGQKIISAIPRNPINPGAVVIAPHFFYEFPRNPAEIALPHVLTKAGIAASIRVEGNVEPDLGFQAGMWMREGLSDRW